MLCLLTLFIPQYLRSNQYSGITDTTSAIELGSNLNPLLAFSVIKSLLLGQLFLSRWGQNITIFVIPNGTKGIALCSDLSDTHWLSISTTPLVSRQRRHISKNIVPEESIL
jgi:hypothetical protein